MNKLLLLTLVFIQSISYADSSMSDLFNKYSSIEPSTEVTGQVNKNLDTPNIPPSRMSSGIHIKVPKYVENPDVVPITVDFDDSIKDGDVLKMYDPKGIMIFKLEPSLGATITSISLRFRLMGGGNCKFVIERGSRYSEYKYVDQISSDDYASIPNMSSGDSDIDTYKEKDGGNSIKMLFRNIMAREEYISYIVVESDSGLSKLTTTPLLTKHPYFKLTGNIPNPKVKNIELSSERYNKY